MLTPVEWEKLANFIIANFVTDETLPAPTPDPSHEVIRALDGLHEAIRENTAAVIRAAEASQALVAKLDAEKPKKPGRPSNAEREAVKALQNEPQPPKPGAPEPMFTELDPPPPETAGEASAAPPPAAAVDDKAPAPAAAAEGPREAGSVVEEPAPAAAAAPPAEEKIPEEVSESDVKRQLRRMQQKFPQDGIARITKILKPYGTARFSDLSPEHYRDVYAAAEAELR